MSDIREAINGMPSIGGVKSYDWDDWCIEHEQTIRKALAVYAAFEDAREVLEGMVWRDIESAPRDGTEFIAEDANGSFYHACYDRHGRVCYKNHWYVRTMGGVSYFHDWTLMCEQGFTPKPIRWMPLPSDTDKIRKLLEAGVNDA